MFRDYKEGDDLLLNCNEFSNASYVSECLESKRYKAKTYQDGKDILCIMLYLEYVKDHYAVFSLVSRDIKFSQLKELKKEIRQAAIDGNAKTFLTFCNKNGTLDKWHKFMGFVKDRSVLSGKAVNMTRWILKWE